MRPEHYKLGELEPFHLIDACGYSIGFYKSNVIKYMLRFPNKNGLEDLNKAEFYILRLADITHNILSVKLDKNKETILLRLVKEMPKITEKQKKMVYEIIKGTIEYNFDIAISYLKILKNDIDKNKNLN